MEIQDWIKPIGFKGKIKWLAASFRLTPKNGKVFIIDYGIPTIIREEEYNIENLKELEEERLNKNIEKYNNVLNDLKTKRMGIKGHKGRFTFIKIEEFVDNDWIELWRRK